MSRGCRVLWTIVKSLRLGEFRAGFTVRAWAFGVRCGVVHEAYLKIHSCKLILDNIILYVRNEGGGYNGSELENIPP